jgi:segregation and condensation protein A
VQAGDFVVDLPLFSGPFRLLAELIFEQKVDVCDVPVARVTDRFLERGVAEAEGWALEEASWFVSVCASLLELKVGRLLPRPAVGLEEEDVVGASPDLVYARSLELAAFRRVADLLVELMAAASRSLPRTAGPPPEYAHLYPDVLEGVTAESLRDVAASLLAPPKDLDLSHVTPVRVSLAEALEAVRARILASREARFSDLLADCRERIEVVVRFLAILELHRKGEVELEQAETFGEIRVRWQDGGRVEVQPGSEADHAGAGPGALELVQVARKDGADGGTP